MVWAEAAGQAARFVLPEGVDRVISLTGGSLAPDGGAITVHGEESPVYVYVPLVSGGAGGQGGAPAGAGQGGADVAGGAPGAAAEGGGAGVVPESASDRSGCGCQTRRGGSGWGIAALMALAWLWLRRGEGEGVPPHGLRGRASAPSRAPRRRSAGRARAG